MYASLALDHQLAKEIIKKSFKALCSETAKSSGVKYGINRACRVLNLSKNVYYYQRSAKDDSELERSLLEKAESHS